MEIIDAQVHLWASGTPSGLHRKVASFSADDLLAEMAEAGVDGAVIHPPSWDPTSNELAVDAVKAHPGRFAILGSFPLDQPASRALVPHWRDRPGMLGLRFALVRPEQQKFHEDGTMDWLWPAAARERLPVATLAWRFLPKIAEIAEKHPGLPLILDHCGLIRSKRDAEAFADLDSLLALARFPNVAVKATGAAWYSTEPYPFRNIHDGLHRIFDAFGPHRFFWGTDLTRMQCSYRQCVTFFTEELPWLTGHDLEMVMGQGIRDWIGWTK